jgi:hypothetical protein
MSDLDSNVGIQTLGLAHLLQCAGDCSRGRPGWAACSSSCHWWYLSYYCCRRRLHGPGGPTMAVEDGHHICCCSCNKDVCVIYLGI